MKKEIVLMGGGGHCKVIIDAIRKSGEFNIYGIVDPILAPGETVLDAEVLGPDSMMAELSAKGLKYAFISVGSIGNCETRKKIDAALRRAGFALPVIIHPKAIVAKDVKLGEGTFVAAGAIINPGVSTGRNVIINTAASVDHDCAIGDFVHIAPGVTLSGGVKVGDETHIGTGAKVTQYVDIGSRALIGAGVTVRHNLSDNKSFFGRHIGNKDKKNRRVFIIAEAGVNHNGSIKIAKKMIDAAKRAGADAVKFQTFKAENVVCADVRKAEYQQKNAGGRESQLDMLKGLELGPEAHRELIEYCKRKGILFLSTPFDFESIELLKKLGLCIFKIPSGEITNLPYLEKIGRMNKRIMLSTGMASHGEVEKALGVLTEAGTPMRKITVLHCNSEYPTPVKDVNLSAMITLKDAFKVDIGYSDHTLGIEVPIAAAALGASVIEKHFTLDRKMKGPDHRASLEPNELRDMVKAIRNIEQAIGDGIKRPSDSERKNIKVARRSIVAKAEIKKGEVFTIENIAVKRPERGISAMQWNKVLGRTSKKDFKRDSAIEL